VSIASAEEIDDYSIVSNLSRNAFLFGGVLLNPRKLLLVWVSFFPCIIVGVKLQGHLQRYRSDE